MHNPADGTLTELMAGLAPHYLQPAIIEHFVALVDDEIAAQTPEVAADAELRRDVDASTRAQLQVIIAAVARGSDQITPPPEAAALARTVARRGLDLRVLLRIYGTARQSVLHFVDEAVGELDVDAETKRLLLVRVWSTAVRWLEFTTDLVVSTYAQEREERARGVQARREETVRALLTGAAIPVDEASRLLDHPLRGPHTALVVWTGDTEPAADVPTRLDRFARACADDLGARQMLTVSAGAREVWAWAAAPTGAPGHAAAHLTVSPPTGLRVAVGTTGRGPAGFVRSHREAVAARRIATDLPAAPAVVHHDDVEVACLVSGDRDALRALVARELAGLAAADPTAARLRETVRTHLACGGRTGATAAALGLHKNTVRYRLEQARDLLGRDLGTRRLKLEIALLAVDTYGAAILPELRA
ncbi:PucR family transcriptional regulator [Speluncibacter jeojiensis]|uniref:Helix-turn-helix domain-containing protein n=1 Tax=Speluncibacter jeojiensis TaxID=2710754 RepID=A0A9X4M6J6_9ACTN|nr:helix-turn-helix domain-containing protein [Corynebacteriales bacterium D3-21]